MYTNKNHCKLAVAVDEQGSGSYTRDSLGRISSKEVVKNGVTSVLSYVFDSNGRLSEAWTDGVLSRKYTYDGNSNRTLVQEGTHKTRATYDDQDRLLTYGARTYQYTAQGDRLVRYNENSTNNTVYTYDSLGALRQAVRVSQAQTGTPVTDTFDYLNDGLGERIERAKNGVLQERFMYDEHGRLIAQLNKNGKILSHFIYASGSATPDYMIRQGVEYLLVHDQIGSVRMVANAETGEIASSMDYDEFGRVLSSNVPGFQPFAFAGGLRDVATGLVRFGARDYDPETGRWLSKDPILFNGGDTNLYGYVMSDPVNLIDPWGLSAADVGHITDSFHQIVDNMTRLGLRHPNPYWNNFTRGISDFTGGRLGDPNRLGCYEQANEAKRGLENGKYDDQWNFTPVDNVFHHWIEGHSSNPNDPVLVIDPWRNTIGTK